MSSILCFVRYYLPGYKAGGPLRSISNTVSLLAGKVEFSICTSDRDLGDKYPYPTVDSGKWVPVDGAAVYYVSRGLREIFQIIRTRPTDVFYLNSFFDPLFSIAPIVLIPLLRTETPKIIVAPRGEFSDGALKLKPWKKGLFVFIAKRLGLYKHICWHASTAFEAADIARVMGREGIDIQMVRDVFARDDRDFDLQAAMDLSLQRAPLRICFVSRISRKKNLDFAISILKQVTVAVVFNIYGPPEDDAYVEQCKRLALELPPHVVVNFCGPTEHCIIVDVFHQHHLFLFPTLGENFGHVIAEALSAGTPVLLSDQTPWLQVQAEGAGWALPLTEPASFALAIDSLATMSVDAYLRMRRQAASHTLGPCATDTADTMATLFLSAKRP